MKRRCVSTNICQSEISRFADYILYKELGLPSLPARSISFTLKIGARAVTQKIV